MLGAYARQCVCDGLSVAESHGGGPLLVGRSFLDWVGVIHSPAPGQLAMLSVCMQVNFPSCLILTMIFDVPLFVGHVQ